MASKYGTNYEKEYVTVPSAKGGIGANAGNVIAFYDELVIDSTDYPANLEVVPMFKIPAGLRFISCQITDNLASGTGQFTVGSTADPDGLAGNYDLSLASQALGTGALLNTVTSAETAINLTFNEVVADAVSGQKISVLILCVQGE